MGFADCALKRAVGSTHPTFLTQRRSRSLVSCSALKRPDRICRRTGAAANRQRRRCQQELPPVPACCRIAQRLEVAVVEEVDAEVEQRKVMHRAQQARWRDILRMIAAKDRDVAFLEPRDDGGIKSRGPAAFGTATQPRPLCLA